VYDRAVGVPAGSIHDNGRHPRYSGLDGCAGP